MAYEFAQHVLDQLATATEIFAAGYVGINFVIYSWKRAESESRLTQPTIIPETTAITEAPLEVLQPLPLSLPKRELVEISAPTSTEAAPIRQLAELEPVARSTEPLPSMNLAPAPIDLPDEIGDAEMDESAPAPLTPAPEPTTIADVADTDTDELEPVAEPTVLLTPAPEPTAIADVADTDTDELDPVAEPMETSTHSAILEPPSLTKPVLKQPPIRPVNLDQSSHKPADKLTEAD